mmetsp:Transcript_15968/g.28411  ORF Transcript_15968/g.28411 Transcript_15968/m.28411 type:complete len:119 (+) Transcript_15968:171-527(+)
MSYVLMFNIKPQVLDGGMGKLTSMVSKYVTTVVKNGGIVRNVRNNGVRPTAYSLKVKGDPKYYKTSQMVSIEFFSPPESIAKIEEILHLEDQLLRFTTLKGGETLPRIPYAERTWEKL